MADEIGQRVAAIHPELDWELGRGLVSRHGFTAVHCVQLNGLPTDTALAALRDFEDSVTTYWVRTVSCSPTSRAAGYGRCTTTSMASRMRRRA